MAKKKRAPARLRKDDGVHVFFQEEVLSDGSKVYNIVLHDIFRGKLTSIVELQALDYNRAVALYNHLLEKAVNTIGKS
jgi:hypothetical protein